MSVNPSQNPVAIEMKEKTRQTTMAMRLLDQASAKVITPEPYIAKSSKVTNVAKLSMITSFHNDYALESLN
jgi:hypothetical protein